VRAEVAPEAPPEPVAPEPTPEVDYSRGGVFDPGEESGELRARSREAAENTPPATPVIPTPVSRPAPTPPRPPTPPTPPAPRVEE